MSKPFGAGPSGPLDFFGSKLILSGPGPILEFIILCLKWLTIKEQNSTNIGTIAISYDIINFVLPESTESQFDVEFQLPHIHNSPNPSRS